MRRYWKIYKVFFSSSFYRELEFRANFVAKILQNVMWVAFFLLILLVIFSKTNNIAGWSRGDALVLTATCFMMNALTTGFFFSLMDIPSQVRQGTLDFVVTKPVDSQFWVSSRRFNFDQIGSLIASVGMLIVGVYQAGLHPGALQWMGYTALVACATAVFYSLCLFLMTTGIWFVRVDNLWVLGETVMQIARYPLDIYATGIQRFFTFILPLAFIATIPARQLVTGFDLGMVALGLLWAGLTLYGARSFWKYAMRHYSSASS